MIRLNNPLIKKSVSFILAIWIWVIQTGCITYYRVSDYNLSKNSISNEKIDALNVNYYFVHVGDKVYQISNIHYSEDGKIEGEIIPTQKNIYDLYKQALETNSGRKRKQKTTTNTEIEQIHFYANSVEKKEITKITESLSINSDEIVFVHLVHLDKVSTAAASTGTTVALTAVVGAAVIGIIFWISCNCPHVYAQEGNIHISNAFVGAVSKGLEQNDVLLITPSESNNTSIRIANEDQNETHYFNKIVLQKVVHDEKFSILSDQNGVLHTLSEIKTSGVTELDHKDDNLFMDFTNIDSKSGLAENTISFKKPADINSNQAKLILRVKNSSWASYVMKEWYKLFGAEVSKHQQNTAQIPAEKQLKWQQEQGITLSIHSLQNDKWIFQNDVKLIGNTVYRDLIVPIEFDTSSDSLTIKLSTGFKLWDIDYLAIDFSADEPIKIEEIEPKNLVDLQKTALLSDDDDYVLLKEGESIAVDFGKLERKGASYFLNIKGYYTKKIEGEGSMKKGELSSFKKKAQMSRYSWFLYNQSFEDIVNNE